MARGSRVKTSGKGRSCTGKRKFETKSEAEKVLWAMRRQKVAGPLMGVYKCKHCDGFHLGHKRRFGKRS